MDANLTLEWLALVVGAPPPMLSATQPAATPVTHAFCLPGHAHAAAAGNTQTTDKEHGKNRQSLGVTSLPTLPYMQKTTETAKKYFCCFRSRTRGLVRPDPTSSLIQSHSDRWPWARSNNYEKRDNLAHTERSDAQSDVGAPVNNYGKRRWSVSFLL